MSKLKRVFVGKTKKGTAARLTPLALLLVAGIAYAAWTITATGAGSAATGALVAPTIGGEPVFAPGTKVTPSLNGDLQVKIETNPSSNGALVITGVSGGTFSVDNPALCPVSNFALVAPTGPSGSIPTGTGIDHIATIPGVVDMLASAPNGCQNRTVTLNGATFTFATP